MKRSIGAVSIALLALGACGDVRELSWAKSAAASGDLASLADESVTCDASHAACAERLRIKGDACLRLAQDDVAAGRARGTTASARAGCAVDAFEAALAGLSDPSGTVRSSRLEALRLARVTARSGADGRAFNARLSDQAGRFASAFPDRDAGPYYRADALYWRAAFGGGATACADLSEAARLAAAAGSARPVADGPAVQGAVPQLEAGIARAAASRGCTS